MLKGQQSTTQAMTFYILLSPVSIYTINILLSLLVLLLPLVLLHLGDEEQLAVLLALLPLRQQRLPRLELHLGGKHKSGLLVETNIAAERPADVYSNTNTGTHTDTNTQSPRCTCSLHFALSSFWTICWARSTYLAEIFFVFMFFFSLLPLIFLLTTCNIPKSHSLQCCSALC